MGRGRHKSKGKRGNEGESIRGDATHRTGGRETDKEIQTTNSKATGGWLMQAFLITMSTGL